MVCYERHPTPVFNGDLVVFVPAGSSPAPTVATHTLWPLFQALNFVSAPCPVPRATLAEALAGPTVGIVAWGRRSRERERVETDGGHSDFLVFTPAGVLRAAVSDAPPTAAQVVRALGPVLADLLGAGAISDVQQAFGDRSVFIFRPDALDARLTIAIRQDRGSLLPLYSLGQSTWPPVPRAACRRRNRPVLNLAPFLCFGLMLLAPWIFIASMMSHLESLPPAVRDRPFMSLIIRFQLMATEGMTPPGAIALTTLMPQKNQADVHAAFLLPPLSHYQWLGRGW